MGHWIDNVGTAFDNDVNSALKAMQGVVSPPQTRRANTSDLLTQYMTQSMDPSGRSTLANYLRETYGDAARFIEPYLNIPDVAQAVGSGLPMTPNALATPFANPSLPPAGQPVGGSS